VLKFHTWYQIEVYDVYINLSIWPTPIHHTIEFKAMEGLNADLNNNHIIDVLHRYTYVIFDKLC
jgi:uncharacterized protein (UPF0371 family)